MAPKRDRVPTFGQFEGHRCFERQFQRFLRHNNAKLMIEKKIHKY